MASSAVTPPKAGAVARRSWARRRPAPAVRPPTTLASAPSMPATTTTASAAASASVWARRRWRPATPTSSSRLGREPVGRAGRPRTRRPPVRRPCRRWRSTTRSGRVGGARPPDARWRRRHVPPGVGGQRGRLAARPMARVSTTGSCCRGPAARPRWRRTARASCPARRPPRAVPWRSGAVVVDAGEAEIGVGQPAQPVGRPRRRRPRRRRRRREAR